MPWSKLYRIAVDLPSSSAEGCSYAEMLLTQTEYNVGLPRTQTVQTYSESHTVV